MSSDYRAQTKHNVVNDFVADVVNDIAYSERSWNQITEAPANNSDTDNKDEMNVFTVESNYNPNVTNSNRAPTDKYTITIINNVRCLLNIKIPSIEILAGS